SRVLFRISWKHQGRSVLPIPPICGTPPSTLLFLLGRAQARADNSMRPTPHRSVEFLDEPRSVVRNHYPARRVDSGSWTSPGQGLEIRNSGRRSESQGGWRAIMMVVDRVLTIGSAP